MISTKRITGTVMFFALVFCVFAITTPVVYAHPKSLYCVSSHHTRQFDAWNIAAPPACTISFQFKVDLTHANWPADIAIDESSNTLFITSEGGVTVELVDASTMNLIGTAPGTYTNNAGIEVDDANDIVYVMRRGTNILDVYDWNPSTNTLTPQGISPVTLSGSSMDYGIALDETTGILWVADASAGIARAYSTTTWAEDMSKSFTPSLKPVDIAVDRRLGIVYTVSMTAGAATPPGTGSNLLSIYEVATKIEDTIDMGNHGVGVAVDEVTGCVYVTSQPHNLEVWNPSTKTLIQKTTLTGPYSPAGICIPQEEVAFNPLSLEKDDGCGGQCVNPGDTITYTISFNNTNPYTVDSVVLFDNMSDYTTFVSATGGGGGYPWSYNPVTHSVTWDIGNLPTASPDSVTLTVTVNSGTGPGTIITNSATIKPILITGGETTRTVETMVCVPEATIESCDSTGVTQDTFNPAEDVYVIGSGYSPSKTYDIYIVEDVTTWTDQMSIPPHVSGTATSVSSDPSGNIPVTPAWSSPLVPGKYDIVVDVDSDGIYDEGKDALDDNDIVTEGFFVIPEYWLGTILGLVGCFAAFGVFRISKRKHP